MKNFKDIYTTGQEVQLKREVDRFPHFIVSEGATGKVFLIDNDQLWVQLDEIIEAAQLWQNCVVWDAERHSLADVEDDIKIL